ncbi:DUF6782 family putative metallopeptidase [Cellulomonas sp. S1-8]|uniref:DUF6782 family putative metallopeptidase n=1 Tax=Cellulomonas sp. S1-8 TaxID=2904790 RepID=UPI002243CC6E|nr:DUF6782 family putative metallopeptidase [Cellulomonas sp. S1-8]UZN04726.1 hypothetical protein OKX07_07420 [Cellulomonas sp. S1-8]
MAHTWRARTPGRAVTGASTQRTGAAPRRRDAGQGTLEYIGVLALVALLVVAVLLVMSNSQARSSAMRAMCQIATLGQGACGEPSPDAPGEDDPSWWCENVGWWCSDDQQDDEQQDEDQQDEEPGWWCETVGWFCPDEPEDDPTSTPTSTPTPSAHPTDPANGLPIVDGVTIPEGMDPDGDAVAALLQTERGREILQWLADQGIPVRDSFQGSYWDGTAIFIDTANTDMETVRTLVHEYNHALNDAEGTSADIDADSRDDYVNGMLDEETQGVVEEIRAARELQDAGVTMPTDVSDTTYWDAYDQAVADGGDEQQARDAAFAAVRNLFLDGTFVTSNTGDPYDDYYGDAWDERH